MDYLEWSKWLEEQYSKRGKKLGFRNWLNNIIYNNETIHKAFKEYQDFYNAREERRASRKLHEIFFLETVVTEMFYSEEYEFYKNSPTRSFNPTGIFASVGDENCGVFYQKLRNSWNGRSSLSIEVPDFLMGYPIQGHSGEEKFFWIEICSALQKKFFDNPPFKTLEDLRMFIVSVGDAEDFYLLKTYGFYVRDIDQLCLAYGILHGYSVEEIFSLAKAAREILKKAHKNHKEVIKPANTTRTVELMRSFYVANCLKVEGKDYILNKNEAKKTFLKTIEANCTDFPLLNDAEHWSTIKKTLWEIINSINMDNRKEEIDRLKQFLDDNQDTGRTSIYRLELIQEAVAKLFKLSKFNDICGEIEAQSELRKTIINRFLSAEKEPDDEPYYKKKEKRKNLQRKLDEIQKQREKLELELNAIDEKIIYQKEELQHKQAALKNSSNADEQFLCECAISNLSAGLPVLIRNREKTDGGIKVIENKIKELKEEIKKLDSEIVISRNAAFKHISYIRAVLIIATIYNIKYSVKSITNLYYVLDSINKNLRSAALREVQYDSISNKEDWNFTADSFDWFIIEAIKFDEDNKELEDQVSGWNPFLAYFKGDERFLNDEFEPEA